MLQRFNSETLTPPVSPYVHAVRHHNTLYLSGLTAFGTEAQNGSVGEQASAIYGANLPASSLLKVEALFAPELKLEIEAVFAV